jgi:hypothetical protein
MSTETKAKSEVIVQPSTKLVKLIEANLNAETTLQSARVALALGIRDEANRNGYDRDQAQTMVKLSFRAAKSFKSNDKDEIRKFDEFYKSRVSTVMALAYPATDAANAELTKAINLNEKAAKKGDRIGENKLIEIARGKLTVADVQAGKTAPRTPSTTSKLPIADQIGNAIAGLFAKFDVKDEATLATFEAAAVKAIATKREALKTPAKSK